jgi:hypothetical protein
VPAVLSTIGAQGSVLANPIFKENSAVFREVTRIDRRSQAGTLVGQPRHPVGLTFRDSLATALLTRCASTGWARSSR